VGGLMGGIVVHYNLHLIEKTRDFCIRLTHIPFNIQQTCLLAVL
jgi:hypothetical protein